MPGCLGLDALWQMVGFFLGWLGSSGRGRALGIGEVKFSGQVLPDREGGRLRHRHQARDALQAGARHRRRLAVGRRRDHLPGESTSRSGCSATTRRSRPGPDSGGAGSHQRDAPTPARRRCGRGKHETGRRHRDGHRLVHRQQHPGSAGEPARGEVRHLARRQIRRARLPLPGARRADARSVRSRSTAAPCASSAAAPPGTTSRWSRRSATPASKTSDISNERTGIIMGSGGPSTRTIVEAADIARTQGAEARRAVRGAEGDVVDRLGDARHLVQDQGRELFDLVGLRDLEPLHRQRHRDRSSGASRT